MLATLFDEKFMIVKHSDASPLIDLGLIEICSNKWTLLDSYKREELFKLLPHDITIKKNAKKSEVIKYILSSHPDVITEIEKITVSIQFSPYVTHLLSYVF